jgi:hypothetical protein
VLKQKENAKRKSWINTLFFFCYVSIKLKC